MRWLITAAMLSVAAPASAAMQTDLGVLICSLAETGERGTTPDSQSRAMLCSFKPKGNGPEESYTGEIKKVGSQTELTGKLVLMWAVMGPADRKIEPAMLEQTYIGEVAPDQTDTSQPPKQLVGERDKSFGLQPVTDEAHEPGAAQSVTVIELRVRSTPT